MNFTVLPANDRQQHDKSSATVGVQNAGERFLVAQILNLPRPDSLGRMFK